LGGKVIAFAEALLKVNFQRSRRRKPVVNGS